MDIDRAQKKVQEAAFFLDKMRVEERDAFGGNQESFEYYLSAFLSASTSMRECFRHARDRHANRFMQEWVARLKPEQKSLYYGLGKERDAEVHHRKASSRKTKIAKKGFGPGTYYFGRAKHDVIAPWNVQVAICLEKNDGEETVIKHVVRENLGGSVFANLVYWMVIAENGTEVEIRGPCISACTRVIFRDSQGKALF